jgi:hypothetical protein
VVLTRQLPGRLDGLGAARGEEHAVEVARGEVGDPGRQLDRGRVGVAPVRIEAKLPALLRGRLGDLGAAVAGVHTEERGEPVEVALVVLVVDVRALTAHDDGDLVLVVVRAHPGEVHPEMAACLLLKRTRRPGVGLVDRLGGCGHLLILLSIDRD